MGEQSEPAAQLRTQRRLPPGEIGSAWGKSKEIFASLVFQNECRSVGQYSQTTDRNFHFLATACLVSKPLKTAGERHLRERLATLK